MPWEDKDEQGQGGSIEYTFTITSSKAGFTEYNEGKTCLLILEGEKEFSNGRVMDDNLWVSVPTGWSCTDDGTSFVKNDDPDARFDKRSKIQQFIKSALDAGVPLKERTENALDTTGWAGLKLHIREEERSFTSKDGELVEYNQPLVVEYLGEVGAGGGTGPSQSAKSSPAAKSNGDGDVEAKATIIAKEVDPGDLIAYMDRVSKELGVPLDHAVCSKAFFDKAQA